MDVFIVAITDINLQQVLSNALTWIEHLGPLGPLAFIGLYILATVAFLPGSILTLGAGVVFGWLAGSLYVFIGATLGATAAFLVGRYLVRGWVSRKIAGNPKFTAIDHAVGAEGFKIVVLTRLSPVFPFNLLNYTFGITQVSLQDYVLGSIGMIPGTLMYVYIGSLAGNLATLGTGNRATDNLKVLLQGLGLAATIALTLYITHIARKALDESILDTHP
jgi:uncharacterized membrane protein YdjX (TVP38/TMEM64 family)